MRWHIFLERGTQQIRTAVHGFADRYLATRSGYQRNKGGGAYGTRTRDPMRDRHVF